MARDALPPGIVTIGIPVCECYPLGRTWNPPKPTLPPPSGPCENPWCINRPRPTRS